MTADVDRILRAHADEAAHATPPPDGWARLEQRIADGDGALVIPIDTPAESASRRRRAIWLAAAAALLVLVASVGVLAATRDDEQSIDMAPATDPTTTDAPTTAPSTTAPPSSSTTAPATSSTTPTTTTETEPPPPARPTSVVALIDADGDGAGDLVVLGADGQVERVLVAGEMNEGPEMAGPTGPIALDVLPDGRIVYEMCCEPAVGEVRIIDPASGAERYLSYGRNPAVSPDGARVVVSQYYERETIHVAEVDAEPESGGPLLAGGQPVEIADDSRFVGGIAWSPDGSRLAIETSRQTEGGQVDPQVEVVDLRSGERHQVPGAVDAAFLADGRLLVSTGAQPNDDEWPTLVGTSLAIVDPATGTSDPLLDAVRVIDLDRTADGRWVLVLSDDGAVWAFSTADGTDQGTVVNLPGLLGASA